MGWHRNKLYCDFLNKIAQANAAVPVAGVGRYGNPRDALRNTVIRGMRYVPPPSAAAANWTMNQAVRPPHAGAMLNRMQVPARGPMCIDPPMYGQQPAGVFQSIGPQGRLIFLYSLCILM